MATVTKALGIRVRERGKEKKPLLMDLFMTEIGIRIKGMVKATSLVQINPLM